MIKEAEVAEELMEFARYAGPGTRMYPSPKADVPSLILVPMKWIQVDPAYNRRGDFARDKKNGIFETVRVSSPPDDVDLTIPENLDKSLNSSQREFVRSIVLSTDQVLRPEFKSAIEVANNVDDNGLPRANSNVTVAYLRESHRPFLIAIQTIETRYQKRKAILDLVKKHLVRISKLPGERQG
jgi:hypothetical protein